MSLVVVILIWLFGAASPLAKEHSLHNVGDDKNPITCAGLEKEKKEKKNKHLYLFQQREGHVPFPVSPGMSLAMPETPSPSPSDILPEPLAEATCLQKYLQPNPLIKRGTQLLNRSVSGVIELKVYQGQSEAKRKYSQ